MNKDFTTVATLIGEPVRANILWTLLDGRALTATELAMAADTSASNISMHLAKLLQAGMLTHERQGRHRYYALASPEVAYAIEALALLMPAKMPAKKGITELEPIRQCRTCYDHLAGRAAVQIADAMLKQRLIVDKRPGYGLSATGIKWFRELGIEPDELQLQRRVLLRPCLDWSERRHHLAGSLPAAFLQTMVSEDWVRKSHHSREVVITAKGRRLLRDKLRIDV